MRIIERRTFYKNFSKKILFIIPGQRQRHNTLKKNILPFIDDEIEILELTEGNVIIDNFSRFLVDETLGSKGGFPRLVYLDNNKVETIYLKISFSTMVKENKNHYDFINLVNQEVNKIKNNF
ncbi:hypothetical protein K6119_09295 [Paracrocinitomix mangrovi]|uniref:hypothetical protein n=1 Tax=Paracrocinitomix mangrovi TaxID=2862509 RepID=UPI001C8D3426|nr:hypothetical protein [Paracrocinitomix mangrovi]UKN03696.1 hypothetical protein K6119_09295 [Paracrocinitomix mangrovi]